jgi:hypothetical protein
MADNVSIVGSYGSLMRFPNLERIAKINDSCIIGAGGEYSDFQYIRKWLQEMTYVLAEILLCVLARIDHVCSIGRPITKKMMGEH